MLPKTIKTTDKEFSEMATFLFNEDSSKEPQETQDHPNTEKVSQGDRSTFPPAPTGWVLIPSPPQISRKRHCYVISWL